MSEPTGGNSIGGGRWLDPTGKRALFEAPVSAAPDQLSSGRHAEGKEALFSTGPRRPGTVLVECSTCKSRSRISLIDLGMRLALSVWNPLRKHSRWMQCPSCNRREWCRVDLNG